jgi:hypothetical protein
MKEQLKESEKQRYEAEVKLEVVQKQMVTLQTDKANLVKDMEQKDKLLKGEVALRKGNSGKLEFIQKELERLRAFEKQFLTLASSLKQGGNAK